MLQFQIANSILNTVVLDFMCCLVGFWQFSQRLTWRHFKSYGSLAPKVMHLETPPGTPKSEFYDDFEMMKMYSNRFSRFLFKVFEKQLKAELKLLPTIRQLSKSKTNRQICFFCFSLFSFSKYPRLQHNRHRAGPTNPILIVGFFYLTDTSNADDDP